MKNEDLLSSIMDLLTIIKDDNRKLMKVLSFMEETVLNSNENKGESKLLESYRDIIPQIVEAVDNDFFIYLNPDTQELEQVESKSMLDMDTSAIDEQNEDMLDEYELSYESWDGYIKFEPVDRDDRFATMENFINQLDNEKLANELTDALDTENPFDEFNRIIQSSNQFKNWLVFKRNVTEDYVKTHLIEELKVTG